MMSLLSVAVFAVFVAIRTTQGQCTSGSSPCQLTCRCSLSNTCPAGVPSRCGSQKCQSGWSGDTCQRNNAGLGTINTGDGVVLESSSTITGFHMFRAFDGDPNTAYWSNSENDPYFWVKLPDVDAIYSMRIVTQVNQQWTRQFKIHVSNESTFDNASLCYSVSSTSAVSDNNINCTEPVIGQYVRIRVQGTTYLNVFEWEIYRCADYWFGDGCSRLCNCRTSTEICNRINGQCNSGCPDGFTDLDCYSVCPSGSFGESCQSMCHCKNETSCNNVNGTCGDDGCAAGYKGDNCQNVCGHGEFGEGCRGQCHCTNESSCHGVDGTCDVQGCETGYMGDNCQDCLPGRFGESCEGTCHCKNEASCDNVNGTCDNQGCAGGYRGYNCQNVCPDGHFGEGCVGRCHCKNQASCNKTDGICDGQGCEIGYKGDNCQPESSQCTSGSTPCQLTCRCSPPNSCPAGVQSGCGSEGCLPGWSGDTCQRNNTGLGTINTGAGDDVVLQSSSTYFTLYMARAFDGNLSTAYWSNSENNPYFWVKLPAVDVIFSMRIETPVHGQAWTSDFQIHVSNVSTFGNADLCYSVSGMAAVNDNNINCTKPVIGQYVRIQARGTTSLSVREWEIYRCADYWFGDGCSRVCNCRNATEICNRIDGQCTSECPDGYTGHDCFSVCPSGSFGEGCHGVCHCKDEAPCNKVDGACDEQGCAAGYKGDNCQNVCGFEEFGEGCRDQCHCTNQSSCHGADGTCDEQGCEAGYKGVNCQQECEGKMFGEDCNQTCGHCENDESCHHVDGTCASGCLPNFEGATCHQERIVSDPGETGDLGETGPNIPLIGGICAGVVALVLVVAAIVLYRKRFRPRSSSGGKNEEISLDDNAVGARPEAVNFCLNNDEPPAAVVPVAADDRLYANTGEVGHSTTVVKSQDFVDYVTRILAEDKLLEKDFEKLPSGLLEKVTEAYKPNNVKKCRYRGLLPYDQTRVVLGVLDGDPSTDFINASYVHGYMKQKAFIASQGTTVINIDDFWRMIWEKEVGKIVMLTNLYESGKEKVRQYWPDEGVAQFGDIFVETIDSQHFVDHSVRTFRVQQGDNVRMVTQFHYVDWTDHGAPRDTSGVIELREKVNQASSKLNGPILVHCSAGVGRSGTYIAFDYLIRKLEAEPEVDVFQTVVELRHQRIHIVQTQEQYAFLHKVLRDASLCRRSAITSDALVAKKTDSPSFRSTIREEFQKLEYLKATMDQSAFEAALNGENRRKNRDPRCIPSDTDRVWLSTTVPGRNNYVNAMSVPAEGGNNRIIATQMPFGDTRIDFWRLVYEQKSTLIVLLNSLNKTDDRFWPAEETAMEIGPFQISLVDEAVEGSLVIRKLAVVYNRTKNNPPHDVQLYCFTGWPEGQDVPTSPVDIVSLKARVFAWQRRANAGSVIVQCRNGTDRTALYCVCDFLLDRLKSERFVNVLLTAKRFQGYFINGMKSEVEYGFCYLVAEAYLNNFSAYANFS